MGLSYQKTRRGRSLPIFRHTIPRKPGDNKGTGCLIKPTLHHAHWLGDFSISQNAWLQDLSTCFLHSVKAARAVTEVFYRRWGSIHLWRKRESRDQQAWCILWISVHPQNIQWNLAYEETEHSLASGISNLLLSFETDVLLDANCADQRMIIQFLSYNNAKSSHKKGEQTCRLLCLRADVSGYHYLTLPVIINPTVQFWSEVPTLKWKCKPWIVNANLLCNLWLPVRKDWPRVLPSVYGFPKSHPRTVR